MPQEDIARELAVKQQNIDQYAGATKATPSSSDSPRKLADWEHVHPPSGRKYTKTVSSSPSGTAKKKTKKRSYKR